MQPLAVQRELQVAGFDSRLWRTFRRPVATVPKLNRPAAILSFRNRAFEVAVVERVIFNFDRQALVVRVERRTSRHRPRFEDAVELEPKIVVQSRGRVFLNYKAEALCGRDLGLAAGFSGFAEVALRAIS
jgi:hypothetical protein